MINGLAGFRIFGAVRADDVYADGARKAQVKGSGGFVLTPHAATNFLDYFLEFKRISMNRNFKIANSMAAGQIPNCVAGQEENHANFAGCLAQLAQSVLL